jgi:hypothetical protein
LRAILQLQLLQFFTKKSGQIQISLLGYKLTKKRNISDNLQIVK